MENTNSSDPSSKYKFILFVSGMSVRSGYAVENLRKLCDTHLAGNYELEIIDIMRDRHLAVEHQIVAIPTLIKLAPGMRRIILGDLSATERVMNLLDIDVD